VPDPIFADPRLAALYDPFDPDRSDLDVYLALARELRAASALDVGCGTGTFACLLALAGLQVTGVDPAAASLAIARTKPGAEAVTWLHGDATTLPPDLAVDLVTMTGNVAQVFLSDRDWLTALRSVRGAVHPGGHVVFEVRDPAKQAWRTWDREHTLRVVEVEGVGPVTGWVDVTDVDGALVSFRHSYAFASGEVLTSDSTLRFRGRAELEASLEGSRLRPLEVRDAPDRPGLELVFVAQRLD
jgi:SAM-dependent methyltransferase